MKTFFGATSKKELHIFFTQTLGAMFSSQTKLGITFARSFRDFA